MKIYIAGKITDNPNFKLEFGAAETKLKEAGHQVLNPATNQGYSYKEYIDAGLFQLMKCDAIYLLRGFETSIGAALEKHYAEACGLKILHEGDLI